MMHESFKGGDGSGKTADHLSGLEYLNISSFNKNDFQVTLRESLLTEEATFLWIRRSNRYLWNFLNINKITSFDKR